MVGLYGCSGVGKSRLLRELADARPEWSTIEGTDAIIQARTMKDRGGGLAAFKNLPTSEKDAIRCEAIKEIGSDTGVTLVTGHYAFPIASEPMSFEAVFTSADAQVFALIIYLDHLPASAITAHRRNDTARMRPEMSETELSKWIEFEMAGLKSACLESGIAFLLASDLIGPEANSLAETIAASIAGWLEPSLAALSEASAHALQLAIAALPSAHHYLLIDGDRTLCAEDTTPRFFDQIRDSIASKSHDEAASFRKLESTFKRHSEYRIEAFLEAAMLYGKIAEAEYKSAAQCVGGSVAIYPEWLSFLEALPSNTHAVVVTAGIREVWLAALAANRLLEQVSLIAGNRMGSHDYVVDVAAKGAVVSELRKRNGGVHIIAFGDSKLDELMLVAADRSYIVLDSKCNRSLEPRIRSVAGTPAGFRSYQLVFGSNLGDGPLGTPPLPLHTGLQMGSLSALLSELCSCKLNFLRDFTTDRAAQLLATRSRQAEISGPLLQVVHVAMGRFVAERLAAELETCVVPITHVQGGVVEGVGIMDEAQIAIFAMMRGGEPMARGVYEVFPQATFLHWDGKALPKAISEHAIDRTVILVDSVINSGKSVKDALNMLSGHCKRVFVVAGVTQEEASKRLPTEFPAVRFFTLRVSKNQYTGKGSTDTGNRLFGTAAV